MIDPHVHLRDWQQKEKETLEHGLKVGYQAGLLAFFDMPNTSPALINASNLEHRIREGKAIAWKISPDIFYGVYAGITEDLEQVSEVLKFHKEHFPDCVGFKMYAGHSTGKMGIIEDKIQKDIYTHLANLDYQGVLAVHCEKESLLKPNLWKKEEPSTHSLARPVEAEVESIKTQIEFLKTTGFKGHLHICHISTAEGVDLVVKAKAEGLNISCGATAHHALLNIDVYKRFGIFAKMNPPVREEKDRKAIFEGLLSGKIDFIESDHAPHTVEDKYLGASGVPGFAGNLKLVQKLKEAGCSEKRLLELCGKNVNSIFNMNLKFTVPDEKLYKEVFKKIEKEYPYGVFGD